MQSKAKTVAAYLAELPSDRAEVVRAVRAAVRDNLDAGFAETMQYGMLSFVVPHSVYPKGYRADPRQAVPFVSVAAQKNAYSLYLPMTPKDPKWLAEFKAGWVATGRTLDMGKACVRFKSIDATQLAAVGAFVRHFTAKGFIASYEQALAKKSR